MSKRFKLKIELSEANNGFILGVVNPEFQNGSTDYYKDTFVGGDVQELVELLVSQLVVERFQKIPK